MANDISRRSFLKTSALGASAVAIGAQSVARGFPANEKAQIGWIGLGGRWRSGLSGVLYNNPNVCNIAVCDLIQERVEQGQERFERDKPNGYTDFRKMMEKEKLDGIIVATQPCNHAEVVAPVLDAGFNCFAEKPVDTTVEKVDIITKAARRAIKNGKFYQVGTQRRYSPTHRKAMEIINGGRLGKVMFMQGHWHWAWRPGARMVARDGGFLVEQASHHTDVFAWAMKDAAPLTCLASARTVVDAPQGPNVINEQQSAVIWTWPTGEILSYTHLLYLARRFQDEKMWVHCEKGGVEVNQGLIHHVDLKENPHAPQKSLKDLEERFDPGVGEDWGAGTKEELEDFVKGVKAGPGYIPNASIETGRISTLMTIMGRMAMINAEKNCFEPHLVKWKDLGSETDL